jgi:hypothetical protein
LNLASIPWAQGGAAALLALAVWLILTGRIVPRQTLQDVQAQRDKYEQAWQTSQATIGELSQQVTALVEVGRTTETLLRSIVGERTDRDVIG